MSSVPFTSTPSSTPPQGATHQPPQISPPIDRQLTLRQVSMICTSTQMLAETLAASFMSAAKAPQAAQTSQRIDVTAVANHLNSLIATLKALGESLLAASVTGTELSTIDDAGVLHTSMDKVQKTPNTRECNVCMEDKPIEDFDKVTDNCTHEFNICETCLRLWLQAAVEENIWGRLACMQNGCDEPVLHSDWQRLASAELFER